MNSKDQAIVNESVDHDMITLDEIQIKEEPMDEPDRCSTTTDEPSTEVELVTVKSELFDASETCITYGKNENHGSAKCDSSNIRLNTSFDIKDEESEISEPISGTSFTASGQTSIPLMTRIPKGATQFKKNVRRNKEASRYKPQKSFLKCTDADHTYAKPNIRTNLNISYHFEEKSFKCIICGFSSPRPADLKQHMRRHTGYKPERCLYCDYSSTELGLIHDHMRTHMRLKPFKCCVCGYSCTQRAHIILHMRVHTGQKPFKCTVCAHSSSQSGALKKHMTIHTGFRPFKCVICNYASRSSGVLTRHLNRAHEKQSYLMDVI